MWPWNLTDDLEKNRTYHLCHFKLCASFCSHQSIQTGVTVRKLPFRVKFGNFWSRMTLKFYGWPWNTIGHLFNATSSFVIISQPSVNSNSSYSPETPNLGQNWRFLVLRYHEIWRMTLKDYRSPLLSTVRLCASFHCHMWIQTGVTIRKRISGIMTSVTLSLT